MPDLPSPLREAIIEIIDRLTGNVRRPIILHSRTSGIQEAIDDLPDTGGDIVIPAGTYVLDADVIFGTKTNTTFIISSGARFLGTGSIPSPSGTNKVVDYRSALVFDMASGGYTVVTHTPVDVGVASGTVLAANTERTYALFVNDSDTVIYLGLDVAAALNQGIRVNANGGSYEMSPKLGSLFTGSTQAVHGGVGVKRLLVPEGIP